MDGGCAWLPMQRVVSRGVPSQFPLGGNTLPPPLLSNSRVYAREGREAKRHLSAAPEIFRTDARLRPALQCLAGARGGRGEATGSC